MKTEIISIGSELVSGQRLDTNSQWLSLRLAEAGIPAQFHSTVGDDLDDNVAVFRTAVERADLVVATGGLGPTQDDLTREALAEVAVVELVFHEPSFEHIQGLFQRRGREMPERNRVQAMFPAGSEPLDNPDGTAPGIWMEVARSAGGQRAVFVALPGVPSEMKRMFEHEVLPRLRRLGAGRQFLRQRCIHCFGLGESAAEEKLLDLTRRGRRPEVGITVHEATITLRITAQGTSEDACRDELESTARIICDRLGDYVFGEGDEELEHAAGRLLNRADLTLATAESGTSGLVGHRLTSVSTMGKHYAGGVIVPSHVSLVQVLGVSPALVRAAGGAGRELAGAMAVAVRERFETDVGLAVVIGSADASGRLGPSEPAERAWIALSTREGLDVREHNVSGDPAIVKSRTAKLGLNILRLHLLARLRA